MRALRAARWLLLTGSLVGCGAGSTASPDLGCLESTCAADGGPADTGVRVDLGGADLGPPDLGPADLGPPDVGPPDTGVDAPIQACGSGGPGMCAEPADCGDERSAPSNCPFCPPDHSALCLSETCDSPPMLGFADSQEVGFAVEGAYGSRLQSLVGVVIAQETPSGAMLDCDEVRRADFDLSGACYNVLTSRVITIFQVGTTYGFQFGRFPGGLPVLLLVYGFDRSRPDGEPLGLSCTPYQAPAPGSGPAQVPGQPMEAL